ncbi:MAG: Fic family protein [Chlamydiales bacterium]
MSTPIANESFLSPKSKDILMKINQPIQARTPVGYNREFLDAYRPNVTRYLPEAICEKLAKLGDTSWEVGDEPYVKNIYDRFVVELAWNSSRLEGNTYTVLETERLLEQGEPGEGKSFAETQMILNHKAAIDFLIGTKSKGITFETILQLHAMLSKNLLADPKVCGQLRSITVRIENSVYYPLESSEAIRKYFERIVNTVNAIDNPFEQSFFLLVHLPYLQPFEDANKRVSRLVANIPFICSNLSPISFADVPHRMYINGLLAAYELNDIALLQDVFIWAYEQSSFLYSPACQNIETPNLYYLRFVMRYRNIIDDTISSIVKECMDKKAAVRTIKKIAIHSLPAEEQERFIEVVENKLRSLHEGNFAAYKLQHFEYLAWHEIWL